MGIKSIFKSTLKVFSKVMNEILENVDSFELNEERYNEEQYNKGDTYMNLTLKLSKARHLTEYDLEWLEIVDNGSSNNVKINTNSLVLERDRKDDRYINTVKNMKLVYNIGEDGILIVMGNLGCTYRDPFGGEFYVTKVINEKNDFSQVRGVDAEVKFGTYPMSNEDLRVFFKQLLDNPNFVYNLSQFDEFMELFDFYKKMSNELNNNVTYRIEDVSKPYHFCPISIKDIEVEDKDVMKNAEGIIIGHKLEDYKFERLSQQQKDGIQKHIDVVINGSSKDVGRIKGMARSIYISDEYKIDERNIRQLKSFEFSNIVKVNDEIVLSGEYNGKASKHLHLYDMGQKIKVESIDNSLRLINQGATGAASQLLEYILGDEAMPANKYSKNLIAKRKYMKGLDESQGQAFMMATDGNPVSLIKGPPGTGKTHVINAIVQYITKELKGKVVISSQTHVAIDNVLDKLMANHDIIIPNRITNKRNKYAGEEIDNTLYETWATKFDAHNLLSKNKSLRSSISTDISNFKGESKFNYSSSVNSSDYSVLGATTTTCAIGGKKGLELLEGYDWLIIDEVSKCPITEVLRYLPYVKNIVLVGDDFQLSPLLEFTEEDVKDLIAFDKDKFEKLKAVYEQSVFAKTLDKARDSKRLVELNVNYRSVGAVLKTYNIFYDNKLQNEREKVCPQKTQFTDKYKHFNENDVFFVEVKFGKEAMGRNNSRYNIEELNATAEILKDLMENTINAIDVTVSAIFPYSAQIAKFQKEYSDLINEAKRVFRSFEIDTVDAFQGKESDIVLVNTVVTDKSKRNFLSDFRRINVAMSRSRDKLFVFGNSDTLSCIDMKVSNGTNRRYFADIISDIGRFGRKIMYEGGIKYEYSSTSKIKLAKK